MSTSGEAAGRVAIVAEVIVTGSNIPTAEEVGPNPVDTYRPADIEKLGIRNATDLTTFLPQEVGGTQNLNISNGGDGTVQFNLRGFLPKETLVLVDGKRVAFGSLGVAGASQAVDVNLLPFVMIDHIDVLKDGFNGPTAVTRVGEIAWVLEGKLKYMNDPKFKDQDPGPFKAYAVPFTSRH